MDHTDMDPHGGRKIAIFSGASKNFNHKGKTACAVNQKTKEHEGKKERK
jgi:hypothetical protein